MFLPSILETNIIYLGTRIYFFFGKNSSPFFSICVFCSVQRIHKISGCPYFEHEKQKYIKYNTKGSLEGSLRDETADFGLTASKHTRDTDSLANLYCVQPSRHKNRPRLKIAPSADNCLHPFGRVVCRRRNKRFYRTWCVSGWRFPKRVVAVTGSLSCRDAVLSLRWN